MNPQTQGQNKASVTPGAGVPKNDALKQGAGKLQGDVKSSDKGAGSCGTSKGSCGTK